MIALGERAYTEARYSRYPLNSDKIARLFDSCFEDDSPFFCIALCDGETIAGVVLGLVTEHFFADMVYATFMTLYVEPEYRGGFGALRLIRSFEAEAASRGANEILVGNSSGINAMRVARLFAALGYQPIGANAIKYIGE
jgi:GNAT superfamily N-acetyltransferase